MIANLLPGLREVRGPLAAGYMWLLVVWLLWGHRLPSPDEADGPLGSLYGLAGVVSVLGSGIALSFIAYLVGSFIGDLLSPPLVRFSAWLLGEKFDRTASLRYWWDRLKDVEPERMKEPEHDTGLPSRLIRRLNRLPFEIPIPMMIGFPGPILMPPRVAEAPSRDRHLRGTGTFLSNHGRTSLEQLAREFVESLADKLRESNADLMDLRIFAETKSRCVSVLEGEASDWLLRDPGLLPSEMRNKLINLPNWLEAERRIDERSGSVSAIDVIREIGVIDIERRVADDLKLVPARLIVKEPNLFSHYDRLRAEADFRFALVPPLLLLALITLRATPYLWVSLVALVLFLRQAVRQRLQAGDVLAESVRAGSVTPRPLEAIESEATALVERRGKKPQKRGSPAG